MSARIALWLRAHSRFSDLPELVADSLLTGYQPTIRQEEEGGFLVAEAFDAAMEAAGSSIRAYRAGKSYCHHKLNGEA